MVKPSTRTLSRLDLAIERLVQRDAAARNDIMEIIWPRICSVTECAVRSWPSVSRGGYDKDDVAQEVGLRVYKLLENRVPQDAQHLWKLIVRQPGFVLRNLKDRIQRRRERRLGTRTSGALPAKKKLTAVEDLNQRIRELPTEKRETLDLIHYAQMSQSEAAAVLNVSVRTIKRRCRESKVLLGTRLGY